MHKVRIVSATAKPSPATDTGHLKRAGISISMDGKGRWIDNVVIERLWRSLKYECVYLQAFSGGHEASKALSQWLVYYNQERPVGFIAGFTSELACF